MSEPGQEPPDEPPGNAGWRPSPSAAESSATQSPSAQRPSAPQPPVAQPTDASAPVHDAYQTPVPHGTTVPGEQVPHVGPPIEPAPAPASPEDQVVFGMESKATRTLMIVCSAVVLLVFVGGGVALLIGHFRTDRGVAECKKVAQAFSGGSGLSTTGTFSEKDYHAIRDPFNDSRYSDLRSAGTRLADELWQLAGNGRQPSIADLAVLQEIEGSYSDLVTACANHGVTVPSLPGN